MPSRSSKKCEVEAIAVCFLWSIVNGAHERRVREIVAAEWPGIPITLSHELNPIPREYRRTISAAINAALHPIVSYYVNKLTEVLRESGFKNELLMANCVGGMIPPEEMIRWADLQRDVGSDPGTDRRAEPDDRARCHRHRHGRYDLRCISHPRWSLRHHPRRP